ncbi:MAG: TonB-dependent receptor [Pseudomonadota bacterium]
MLGAPSVYAQQSDDETEDAADIEEIVITGSRLRRDSFNVPMPLVQIDNEVIVDAGLGSLAEILIDEIPSLYESTSNTNSQSSVSQTGLSTVNLRRLGSNRTLTLIDGRRVVPSSFGGTAVSLSTIPASIIDSVEIITGGSSAAYGSDAIAGVVNIITEKDKTGFGIETRGGATSEGGGEEYTIDVDFGTHFAQDRGYFFIGATYQEEQGIDHLDRDRARLEANYGYDDDLMCNTFQTANGDECARDITPADWRDRSDGTPGGVFSEGDGNFWYNENGLQTDFEEERDGYFSRVFDVIKIPNETTAVAAKVDFEFTETTRGYVQVQYSRDTSFNFKSPEDDNESSDVIFFDPVTGEPGEVRPGHIELDNPFVPDAIRNDPAVIAEGELDWDRRFFEVGNITTDNTRTTLRTWAGLQGSFLNDEWLWDVSVGYGDFEQEQLRSNELNTIRVAQALDAELAPDGVTVQCADPDARAAGCVPLNLFGIGSITPEMADWIRANPTINSNQDQFTAIAYISGDLFELPAGPVATVFGAEFRRDTLDLSVGGGHETGGITFNVVPAFSGDIDVAEVFAEASFPLFDRLSAEVGLRVADYSPPGISTVFSYSTGLIWEPIDGYNLRANFARAQRAPTITELISPPRGDFDSYDDICDGATATSTDPGHDNCRLDPLVAAAILAEGEFEDDNNSYSPNGGNPNLFEETANTFTVGFSIAPGFLNGFRLAVDYYDITVEDAIDSVENVDILNQCYNSSVTFGDPNPFCDAITRDDDGQIREVLQQDFNLNETTTSGFDVTLEYEFDLGRYGGLELSGNYTRINDYETIFQGNDGLETVDFNNQLDFGIFEDVARASLTWRTDDWRVRWRTTWQGPILDSQSRVDEFNEALADNAERCANGDPDCVANPETPSFLFYPSTFRHSLSVAYDTEIRDGTELRLSAGVRNIFDDDPFVPRTGDNDENGIGNYDSKFNGGIGRFYFVGAELRFGD